MRLSTQTWKAIRPLIDVDRTIIECDYNGKHRVGIIDTIGEGPNGPFLTVRQNDGNWRNFSINKIENLEVRKIPQWSVWKRLTGVFRKV